MVLKYKGDNDNWVYVEANSFSAHQIVFPEYPEGLSDEVKNAKAAEYVTERMKFPSGCPVMLLTDKALGEIDRCVIVTYEWKEKREAIVLYDKAYLMTDNGKTIERIA